MEQEFRIYKAENVENGWVYIGLTTSTLEKRKKDHIQKALNGKGHQFQEAIETYGPEAFYWAQIDTASSIDELAVKEKAYVIQYDSKENGYNSDKGGGIQKTVYQYSINDRSLVNSYDSLQSAANAVSAYKTCVGNACTGQSKTCKGFYWSYNLPDVYIPLVDKRLKRVKQFDLDGLILAEYKSVAEASRETGVSKTCISRVCRGERNHTGGYRWGYY